MPYLCTRTCGRDTLLHNSHLQRKADGATIQEFKHNIQYTK